MLFWSTAAGHVRALRAAIRADAAFYLTLLVYLIAGSAYVLARGGMLMGALDIYANAGFITYVLILPFVVLVAGIARITHRLDARRRLAYRIMFSPRRVARFVAGTLLMLLGLLPFESMFASIKSTIADGGFTYDRLVADLDKFIHFGHAPAKYLYWVAKQGWVLRGIEFNYDVLWFVLCFGALYWVAISPRADGFRLRYFGAFFFVWVLVGNVAAGLLPTAGPAFYSLVTGDPDRFNNLRTFVETTAGTFSSAADEQHYLWTLHTQGLSGFGSGISAFPSMHVALIALNAMFLSEYDRRWAPFAWGYVALIVASSVYLGWHYAVDGYVALLMSAAIYWAARRTGPLWAALRQGSRVARPAYGAEAPAGEGAR